MITTRVGVDTIVCILMFLKIIRVLICQACISIYLFIYFHTPLIFDLKKKKTLFPDRCISNMPED